MAHRHELKICRRVGKARFIFSRFPRKRAKDRLAAEYAKGAEKLVKRGPGWIPPCDRAGVGWAAPNIFIFPRFPRQKILEG